MIVKVDPQDDGSSQLGKRASGPATTPIPQHPLTARRRIRAPLGNPPVDDHFNTFDIRKPAFELLVVLIGQFSGDNVVDHVLLVCRVTVETGSVRLCDNDSVSYGIRPNPV